MQSSRVRMSAIGATFLATILLACACGNGSQSPTNPIANRTVTMTLPGPVTSFDPAKNTASQAHTLDLALYDTLVDLDSHNGVIPGLASSWQVTASSVTFKLRTNATCSDGTKVTPDVVAGSLRRFFAPETNANVTFLIGPGNQATVSPDDAANTVRISMSRPYGGLIYGMANFQTSIICPAGVNNPALLTTHSEGSGPFVLQSEVSGSTYTMTARQDYDWGPNWPGQPGGQLPSQLIAQVVTDENAAANLMLTGAADVSGFTTTNVSRVEGKAGFSSTTEPLFLTYLQFNELAGHPTASESTRTAIAEAINRMALNSAQTNGKGKLMSSLGTAGTCAADPGKLIPSYKPTAAKAVLGGAKLRMIGSEILNNGDAQAYVQAALGNAGAQVSLTNMNNQAWIADMSSGKNDWDLTIQIESNAAGNFFVSANSFLGPVPPAGHNYGNVENADAYAAFMAASTSVGSQQCEAWVQMENALLVRHDILPLASAPITIAFDKRATGLGVNGYLEPGTFRVR